jgi:hypothetical protein
MTSLVRYECTDEDICYAPVKEGNQGNNREAGGVRVNLLKEGYSIGLSCRLVGVIAACAGS